MNGKQLKRAICDVFDIPYKNISLKTDNGWVKVRISDSRFTEYSECRQIEMDIESFIIDSPYETTKYIRDDEYDTEVHRITVMVS